MRVLAISGSLRAGSFNSALLDRAARLLPDDVEVVRWAGLDRLPAYNPDLEGLPLPRAAAGLRSAIESSDAVVIATPEYNASIPGALKNALDWASRPFPENCLRDKPVAVLGASTSLFGAVWAQAELRKVLRTIGAHVCEREVLVPEAHRRISEPELDDRLRELLDELLERTALCLSI